MSLLRHAPLLLFVGIALAACNKRGPTTDVCAHGACDAVDDCQLGLCNEPSLGGSTIATHSPNAGVQAEGESAECQYGADDIPDLDNLLDDSAIPQFRRSRARKTNMNQGNAVLQDHELHENLLSVQGRIFECLDLAACYEADTGPIGGGELDFQFELEPDGHVSAVSVTPSLELDKPVVIACARRSLYEATFPSWNGGRMVVDYSVEIEESA